MRTSLHFALCVSALSLFSFCAVPAKAQDPVTVGAVLVGAKSLVADIKDGASELIEQGNVTLGVRLELLASQLELTLDRVEERFDRQRSKVVSDLRGVEFQTITDLDNLVNDTAQTFRTATGATIFETQAAINQILDKLPFIKQRPLVTGVAPRSVVQLNVAGIDAYIFGFSLQDSRLNNKLPKVIVDGVELTGNQIGVTQSGLQLMFSPDLKQKIGVTQTGSFRRPVLVEVTAYRKEGWPFASTKSYRSQFFLDPGPPSFRVTGMITYRGIKEATWVEDKVRNSVDTERVGTRTLTSGPPKRDVSVCTPEIPGNIRKLSGRSWWTWDKNRGKPSSSSPGSPSVGGNKVCVNGWIKGHDAMYGKGLYATLNVEATFEREVVTRTPSSAPFPETVISRRKVAISTDADRGSVSSIRLDFIDSSAETVVDSLSINLEDGIPDVTTTSTNGLFEFRIVGSSAVITPLISGMNVSPAPTF